MQGPFKQWGSAVFSPRYPLQRVGLPEDSNLRRFGSYLAFATASLPDGSDVVVASVHARDGEATPGQLGRLDSRTIKRPSLRKPRVNDAVFGGLVEMIDGPFILGGDWNTARTQSARRAGEEFFERVKEQGWWDCVYRGTGGKELQTWFGGRGGKLIQDDHVFCSKELGKRLRRAWVATQASTELRLSDHAPLVIEFEVESVAMENLST
jgi:endonuclease/exonuclease/phosphatase family metal-dependent hydrolase